MARDSLRSTLDDLKLGPEAANDRPYLEAMLRRLGYTESEIEAELGAAEAAPAPEPVREQDFGRDTADDGLAPAREYRLVVPARESAFTYAEGANRSGSDSPFEDFERVEFEETAPAEDAVEFEEVAAPVEEPGVAEFEEAPLQEFEEAQEFEPTPVETLQADEAAAPAEDVRIDTFGAGEVDTKPKTRVRVKRVRAKSKAEAEGKVASANRKVIKSIPVDIVERWGDKGERKGAK